MNKSIPIIFSNLAEWYNFILFASLAPVFSDIFLPKGVDQFTGIVITFSIFSSTYIMRPMGGVVLGRLSDRIGRLKVFDLSVLIMASTSIIISILPSYANVGYTSVIVLACCRLFQAFSISGEYVSSTCFIYELYGCQNEKLFYTSFISFGTVGGTLFGFVSLYLVSQVMDSNESWRILFVFIAVIFIISWCMRRKYLINLQQPFSLGFIEIFTFNYNIIIKIMVYTSFASVGFYYYLVSLPILFEGKVGPSYKMIVILGLSVSLISLPIFAYLLKAKRVKVFQSVSIILTFLSSILISYASHGINNYNVYNLLLVSYTLYGIFYSMFFSSFPFMICRMLPSVDRGVIFGTSYNFASMIFGGTTPILMIYLNDFTTYGASIYLAITAILTLIIIVGNKFK